MKATSQTRFLSENYSALHGLKAVPLGACLFLTSLWANVVQYPIKNFLLPVALILAALLLSLRIDQYYRDAFGEIRPTSANRRLYWMAQSVGGLLGLVAFWLDVTLDLPISLVGLLFALILLLDKPMVNLPLDRFSAVRLVASICVILVSMTPMFFGRGWWNILGVRATLIGVTMFVGAVMVLQGVLWHIFFVRSLPLQEVQDE